jgi:hypothetical protein
VADTGRFGGHAISGGTMAVRTKRVQYHRAFGSRLGPRHTCGVIGVAVGRGTQETNEDRADQKEKINWAFLSKLGKSKKAFLAERIKLSEENKKENKEIKGKTKEENEETKGTYVISPTGRKIKFHDPTIGLKKEYRIWKKEQHGENEKDNS